MNLREELQRNVRDFEMEQEKKREQEYQERLKECEGIIEEIKDNIINASLQGQTKIVVRRVEDTLGKKSYANEIKEYFEREGLTVKIKIDNAITSMYGLFDSSFNSLEEKLKTYYYTIKISWEEEK